MYSSEEEVWKNRDILAESIIEKAKSLAPAELDEKIDTIRSAGCEALRTKWDKIFMMLLKIYEDELKSR